MAKSAKTRDDALPVFRLAVNEDKFGEHRGLGVSVITFKVTPKENDGIFIIENTFHEKGGPARHLHYYQDEWFYAVEGNFLLEVGDKQFTLEPGDSVLAPRKVPHVWAYTGGNRGRMLIAFMPAGKMEAFFREVTRQMRCRRKTRNCGARMTWNYSGRPYLSDLLFPF